MVRAIRAFLEFAYLVRRDVHSPKTINQLTDALVRFHRFREAFRIPGVRPEGFSLPRQHSMVHYEKRIWDFGAPNGLCSSITESKHIKAVKEPWRRSNRYEALGQMLLTNQRMDKLAISRVMFSNKGMLQESCLREAQVVAGQFDLLYPSSSPANLSHQNRPYNKASSGKRQRSPSTQDVIGEGAGGGG